MTNPHPDQSPDAIILRKIPRSGYRGERFPEFNQFYFLVQRYISGKILMIWSEFLRKVANRQTDKQTPGKP